MKRLIPLLSHGCLILALALITLLIVDRFNPSMDFINNDFAKILILLLCVLASVVGVATVVQSHRNR